MREKTKLRILDSLEIIAAYLFVLLYMYWTLLYLREGLFYFFKIVVFALSVKKVPFELPAYSHVRLAIGMLLPIVAWMITVHLPLFKKGILRSIFTVYSFFMFFAGFVFEMNRFFYNHVYVPLTNSPGDWQFGMSAQEAALPVMWIPTVAALILGIVAIYYFIKFPEARASLGRWKFSLSWKSYFTETYDLNICKNLTTSVSEIVPLKDFYLGTLVVGPQGSGKTSSVLMPWVFQLMVKLAKGMKMAITCIEPKGDFSEDVAKMAKITGMPYIYINPLDENTPTINPFIGPPDQVAEVIRTTLVSMFGKQEAFFRQTQETLCRNAVLLLKYVKGDRVTFVDLARVLRDEVYLVNIVNALSAKNTQLKAHPKDDGPYGDLLQYFKREILGANKDKMNQFAIGLRMQVEDIVGNKHLRRALACDMTDDHPDYAKSSINLDKHLAEGGILSVNTALGELGKLGNTFGLLVIMSVQNAVFRRPLPEENRITHIMMVDELPLYITKDLDRLLAVGRSFRTALIAAVQSLQQLAVDGDTEFRDLLIGLFRNKMVFGGLEHKDCEILSQSFGEVKAAEKGESFTRSPYFSGSMNASYRESYSIKEKPRFTPTDIREMPFQQVIYQFVKEGSLMVPQYGMTDFLDQREYRKIKGLLAQRQKEESRGQSRAGQRLTLQERFGFGRKAPDYSEVEEANAQAYALAEAEQEARLIAEGRKRLVETPWTDNEGRRVVIAEPDRTAGEIAQSIVMVDNGEAGPIVLDPEILKIAGADAEDAGSAGRLTLNVEDVPDEAPKEVKSSAPQKQIYQHMNQRLEEMLQKNAARDEDDAFDI